MLCPQQQSHTSSFKQGKPFHERREEFGRIRQKYPDMVPVICEQIHGGCLPNSNKRKYLVPSDLTLGQFQFVIRKRIKIPCEQAMFLFVNGMTLAPTNSFVSELHRVNQSEDGFLYLTYSSENTFG